MRCLIVDDEAPARHELRQLLSAHPELEIVGEAARIAEALPMCQQLKPDVIFLDIQLRGETGFDLLSHLPEPLPRIIFVTAYDKHAVRAFECNALDYLLKPVHPLRLRETVSRLQQPATPPPRALPEDVVLLKIDSSTRFVPWKEIQCVESEGNYTRVTLVNHSQVLVLKTLKEWEDQAPKELFLRIHRTALIRLQAIEELRSSSEVILTDRGRVPIGRAYWPDLRAMLKREA